MDIPKFFGDSHQKGLMLVTTLLGSLELEIDCGVFAAD